jgi:hypothetical protein
MKYCRAAIAVIMLFFISFSGAEATASENGEILAATRAYVDAQGGGVKYDLELLKRAGNWAFVSVLPKENIEGAGVILEKVNGKWIVRDMGTDLSDWDKKAPKLFE